MYGACRHSRSRRPLSPRGNDFRGRRHVRTSRCAAYEQARCWNDDNERLSPDRRKNRKRPRLGASGWACSPTRPTQPGYAVIVLRGKSFEARRPRRSPRKRPEPPSMVRTLPTDRSVGLILVSDTRAVMVPPRPQRSSRSKKSVAAIRENAGGPCTTMPESPH